MPTFLLIGIPILVVVILLGIMSLPDEDTEKSQPKFGKPVAKSKKKKK